MKKFNLKAAALAASVLFCGSAMAAALNLSATPTTTKYAQERAVSSSGTDFTNPDTFETTLGVTLGAAQQGYLRIDLSNGAKFKGAPTATVAGAATTLSSGGDGATYAVFTVAAAAGNTLSAAVVVTPNATGLTLVNKNAVAARIRLYETQAAAQNPDNSASLALSDTGSKNVLEFTKSITSSFATAVTQTADVAPSSGAAAYTQFTTAGGEKILGTLNYSFTATRGTSAVLSAADILANTNSVTFTGASGATFAFLQNADGTYTGTALTKAKLKATDCSGADVANATSITASTVTFSAISDANIAQTLAFCVTPQGNAAIESGSITGAASLVGETNYTPVNPDSATTANIDRNGTTLVGPLVSQPAGWYSRLVLTNTGSSARTYTVTAYNESGTASNTVSLSGDAASGSVPANSTKVIDLDTLATVTGATGFKPRFGLRVVVNGPASQISGLYQLANGTTSNVSSYPLVAK